MIDNETSNPGDAGSSPAAPDRALVSRCARLLAKPALRATLYYSAVALATWFCLFLGLRLWERNLAVPITFEGDALHHAIIAKSLTEQAWWHHIDRLSAPFTLPMVAFPVGGNVDYLLIRLLALLHLAPGTALNSFWLLSIILAAVFAVWCLNLLKVAPPIAFTVGVLFALLPHTYYRNIAHLMLVTYLLPPALTLAVMLGLPRLLPQRRSTQALLLGGTFALGLNYVYFAFFATFMLLTGGLIGFAREPGRRTARWALSSIAIICLGTLLGLLPTLHYWSGDEPARVNAATRKSVGESDTYGLALRHLFLPVDNHLAPPLAAVTSAYDNQQMPADSGEGSHSRLGLVGSIGVVLVLLTAIGVPVLRSQEAQERLRLLAGLALAMFLMSTIGGLGSLWNMLVSPAIRCYGRAGAVIGFYALAAFAVVLTQCLQRWPKSLSRPWAMPAFLLLLVLGAADQYSGSFLVRLYNGYAAKYSQLQQFVGGLEGRLPHGAAVYQMPYVPYPNAGPTVNMPAHDHLAAYLVSSHLRWSFPVLSGKALAWNASINSLSRPEFVAALSLAGFDAIWVDRSAYEMNAADLVGELTSLAGPPLASSVTGHIIVFGLGEVKRKVSKSLAEPELRAAVRKLMDPQLYDWGETLHFGRLAHGGSTAMAESGWTATPDAEFRWTEGRKATLRFHVNPASGDKQLLLHIGNYLPVERMPVTLSVDGQAVRSFEMNRAGDYQATIPHRMLAGKSEFELALDVPLARSPRQLGVNADQRLLGLAVHWLRLQDLSSAPQPDKPAPSLLQKAAAALAPSVLSEVETRLTFTRANAVSLAPLLLAGWSPELATDFRWTEGRHSAIRLQLKPAAGGKTLFLRIKRFIPRAAFPVTLSIDNTPVGKLDLAEAGEYRVFLPAELVAGKGLCTLSFDMSTVTSPKDQGLSADPRLLGLAVAEIRVQGGADASRVNTRMPN